MVATVFITIAGSDNLVAVGVVVVVDCDAVVNDDMAVVIGGCAGVMKRNGQLLGVGEHLGVCWG